MINPLLQSAIGECGVICLAMIAQFHGRLSLIDEIRRNGLISQKGGGLPHLIGLSARFGFTARPVRLELYELIELQLPCILHWDLNHFVVLTKTNSRHATILDPAVGERRMRLEEVSRHFTGVALELTPNAEFRPQSGASRLRLSQLTGKVRGLPSSLLQIFAVAAALQLFALVAPLFSQLVVDEVITSGDHDMLTVLVLGFGLLLVVQTSLGLARSWMVMVLGQSLSLQWAGNVFAHLLRLPVDYFEQRHLGDIVSRFGSIGAIQRTLTTAAIEAVLDGVLAVAALIMMLVYSPTLTGVVIGAVAAYGLLRWAAYRPLRDASAERLVIAARENTHFLETLRAITPLKLFSRESGRLARWQNLLVDVQNRDVRTAKLNIAFGTANTFIFGLENLLVLWLGAKAVMATQGGAGTAFTVGMLFAFMAYKAQFSSRVSALINYVVEFRMLGLHSERLADIALTAPERDNPKAEGLSTQIPPNDLAHLRPSLELRDVSFRYGEGEPWVLRHASLKVDAGEIVAVTGASGCGKSTLLKLLLGLLQPSEGEVLYGGIPVRQLGLTNVRRQLGTVMQEDVLLTGSLADNIAFFDEQPDQARIEACARIAQVHEDIVRMPMGYHTLVGDLGHGLSGGQKQRVLLARALYKQPRVLALDEATSHLDLANERAVTQALTRMRLTRLVIAHRPETIAGAQRVVLLKDGQIQELVRQVQTPNASTIPVQVPAGLNSA
ncbi:peptidase domain-containing ABC transporter [Piscinibacter sp.]|uniref:peptidase domain-containing ABC transporter n=1 Tax=Piscinibacter sp. TaxID=1903157 RepID=UPI0039E6D818